MGLLVMANAYAQKQPKLWYPPYVTSITASLPKTLERPIVIAVIDDGFRLDHEYLKDFIYKNELEIPGNQIDDDGNGYVDDEHGWDVSDQDANPRLPLGRANTFYHGTFVTGAITHLLQQSFGEDASQYFKILPVKVLSDQAKNTYLKDGYQGIAYAIAQKADIIVCAWNGGFLSSEENLLLQTAQAKGITILASAGNFNTESTAPPAAHPAVYSVAAIDSNLQKLPKSNYGQLVDLTGPGQAIWGASSLDNTAGIYGGESSAAVAVIAAAFAQLKAFAPNYTSKQLLRVLKNTAIPLEPNNPSYAGKLGAGLPNLPLAIEDTKRRVKAFQAKSPKGYLSATQIPEKATEYRWQIEPKGQFKGIWFKPSPGTKWPKQSQLSFFNEQGQRIQTWSEEQIPSKVFIPGNQAHVWLKQAKKKGKLNFDLDYYVETVDSTKLYCQSTQIYEMPKGQFSDGSGQDDYTSSCDCKWQIRVPEGQRVRIRFSDFDTQANIDFVYLFDGESPTMQTIIAKFSGQKIPPMLISRSNKVLVWFVTDQEIRAKGWTLEYEAIE